ncbi:hypothetical protein D3C76_1053200 [compost metagenome]
MLTDKGGGGLGHARLFGKDFGLGRIDIGLQVLGVEPGQDLVGLDVIADVDAAGNDLAAHAKRKIGLHPRLNITGQRHRSREITGLNSLYADPGQLGFSSLFFAAPRQHQQHPQADDR